MLFVHRTCILLRCGKFVAADALFGCFLPRLGPLVATQAASFLDYFPLSLFTADLSSLRSVPINSLVRKAIEAAGATQCFLPPYSPDFDPIEQVFAKLKNTLRKMAPRTVDALWYGIGLALDDFSPTECCNYFRNAYEST